MQMKETHFDITTSHNGPTSSSEYWPWSGFAAQKVRNYATGLAPVTKKQSTNLRISLDDSFTQVYQVPGHPLHPPSTPHICGNVEPLRVAPWIFQIKSETITRGLAFFRINAHIQRTFTSVLPTYLKHLKQNVYQVRSFSQEDSGEHVPCLKHLSPGGFMFDFVFSIFFAVCLMGRQKILAIARIRDGNPWDVVQSGPLFPKYLTFLWLVLNPCNCFGTVDGHLFLGSFFNAAV